MSFAGSPLAVDAALNAGFAGAHTGITISALLTSRRTVIAWSSLTGLTDGAVIYFAVAVVVFAVRADLLFGLIDLFADQLSPIAGPLPFAADPLLIGDSTFLSDIRYVIVNFAIAVVIFTVASLFFGNDLTDTASPLPVLAVLLARLTGSGTVVLRAALRTSAGSRVTGAGEVFVDTAVAVVV